MDDGLANLMRREAAQPANARAPLRVAEVTSWNPETHAAKVKIWPEGDETGWLPAGAIHIGNGHGVAIGLTEGDQVVVGFLEGDHSAPYIAARMYSDQQKPPKVKSGEIAIWHKSGTRDFYAEDGSRTHTHAKGGTVTWDKDGHLTTDNKAMKVATKAGAVSTEAGSVSTNAANTIIAEAGKAIQQQAGKIFLNCG